MDLNVFSHLSLTCQAASTCIRRKGAAVNIRKMKGSTLSLVFTAKLSILKNIGRHRRLLGEEVQPIIFLIEALCGKRGRKQANWRIYTVIHTDYLHAVDNNEIKRSSAKI
jgi:hypothetical protein